MFNFSDLTTAIDYLLEYRRGRETRQLESNVRQILLELLEAPDFTKRSFEKLLEQSVVFENDHHALRRQLIVLGARRYTSSDDKEMWGLKTRNVEERPEPPSSRASKTSTFIGAVTASIVAAAIIGISTKVVWPNVSDFFSEDAHFGVQLATYQPENCALAAAEVAQYIQGGVFSIDPVIFETEAGLNVVVVPAATNSEAMQYRTVAIAAADRFPDEDLARAFVVDLRSTDWTAVDCVL